jgi:hypothetical protein
MYKMSNEYAVPWIILKRKDDTVTNYKMIVKKKKHMQSTMFVYVYPYHILCLCSTMYSCPAVLYSNDTYTVCQKYILYMYHYYTKVCTVRIVCIIAFILKYILYYSRLQRCTHIQSRYAYINICTLHTLVLFNL